MGSGNERRENVLLGLGAAMIAVWIIGVMVQVAFPSHPLPAAVHGIVGVLVPILFGGAWIQARKIEKEEK